MKKKVTAVIIALSVISMLLLLAACSDDTANNTDKKATPPPVETPTPTPPPTPTPQPPDPVIDEPKPEPQMQAPQTYEDAVAICIAWLDERSDLSSYTIYDMAEPGYPVPPTFSILEERYYEIYVVYNEGGAFEFSHLILVHEETGELASFSWMISNEEHRTYTLESLDDWYTGERVELTDALLSADEALEIYYARIDDLPPTMALFNETPMNEQSTVTFVLFGEQYYHFIAEEDYKYWFNILVHMDTGDMLFMFTSDGLYPETEIMLLEYILTLWQ